MRKVTLTTLAPALPDITADTGSSDALQWAMGRYSECRREHAGCTLHQNGYFPCRLVDVSPRADGRDPILVDTNSSSFKENVKSRFSDGMSPCYVCLSHCWAEVSLLRALQSNIEISVAAYLGVLCLERSKKPSRSQKNSGIRYIGIDSPCFLQDSKQDWSEQAAAMADIHKNSMFTIAATASSDGKGGLYRRLDELIVQVLDSGTDELSINGPSMCCRRSSRPANFC